MPSSTTPSQFDPSTASAGEWARFHAFRRQRHSEAREGDPVDSDRLAEIDLKRYNPEEMTAILVTDDGSEVSSAATFWSPRPGAVSYDSNRGILWFDLYVLKGNRGRGIARSYLPALLELAGRNDGKVIGVSVEDADCEAAALAYGFAKKSEERHSRLDLQKVDWREVARWAEDGPRRSPDRGLRLYTNWPPREEWPEYTRVISELFNSIPFDDEEHGEIAITPAKLAELTRVMAATDGRVLSLVVREADGRITGLTEMAMWEEQVGYAWQWLTAVHRSAQGKGIGRWLKAAMLIHIREHHPLVRWVLTGNAISNAPMLKINAELGFKPYRTTAGYQMPMAEFAAAVGRRAGPG